MTAFRLLTISATAARTAVGDDVDQTCAVIRANIIPLREDPLYSLLPRDPEEEREPVRTARVSTIDPSLDGKARLFALLEPTLTALLDRAPHLRRDARRAALLVALPAPDAVTDTWQLDTFAAELAARLALPFADVRAIHAGHAGALALLADANAMLGRSADACIVAGVDSYLTAARLAHYDQAERLKSARNVDGFFPGEAAGAVVVEVERHVTARGETPQARLVGMGSGSEPETVKSDKPSTGKGLTDAIRAALGEGGAPRWTITDFNGETYRGYEWGLVHARLGDRLNALEAMSHPLRNTGDIGAATGAVQIALAAAAFRRGWAPADEVLLFAGSDGPERAAARLLKP